MRIFPAIEQIEYDLPEMDLITWVDSQEIYPKVFWKQKDHTTTRVAIGQLLTFDQVPSFDASTQPMRVYGGMRFDERVCREQIWRHFPRAQFWLPDVELIQKDGKTQAIFYFLKGLKPKEIRFVTENKNASEKILLKKRQTPHFDEWKTHVECALKNIHAQALTKLVPARMTTLQFEKPLCIWPILRHLNDNAKHATVFAFQMQPDVCFMGATPEKLFERRKNTCIAEAVAATRPCGKTPEEDRQLEKELFNTPKELAEFKIVKDFLTRTFLPLTESMRWEDGDKILKGSHVQHLSNRLHVQLKPNISDAELLDALHPTPAVGGFPQKYALDVLRAMEPFDRGWYAAPIGVISPQETAFYVGIRSALIRHNTMHLFAGTGIVPGSCAEQEWNELEQKIHLLTEIVNGYRTFE